MTRARISKLTIACTFITLFLPFRLLSQATNAHLNIPSDSIRRLLDSIDVEDQRFRNQLNEVAEKHGGKSSEMKLLMDSMRRADSSNMLVVRHIIDIYGWPGVEQIGATANETLFMVIQHASLTMQKKYLPIMKDAVASGNAKASSLGLLIDRIELKEGRMQVYGTQVSWNMATDEYYLLPLIDPDNVDKRRREIGMVPIEQYLRECNLIWDIEAYKKDIHSLKKVVVH